MICAGKVEKCICVEITIFYAMFFAGFYQVALGVQ